MANFAKPIEHGFIFVRDETTHRPKIVIDLGKVDTRASRRGQLVIQGESPTYYDLKKLTDDLHGADCGFLNMAPHIMKGLAFDTVPDNDPIKDRVNAIVEAAKVTLG
jgi:hypothetical protein